MTYAAGVEPRSLCEAEEQAAGHHCLVWLLLLKLLPFRHSSGFQESPPVLDPCMKVTAERGIIFCIVCVSLHKH